MSLDSTTAARSRARLHTQTITIHRSGSQVASVAGRIVPMGTQNGAWAPVATAAPGLSGGRTQHLALLEDEVSVLGGDEVHEGSAIYYAQGPSTLWEGLTTVALELVR